MSFIPIRNLASQLTEQNVWLKPAASERLQAEQAQREKSQVSEESTFVNLGYDPGD